MPGDGACDLRLDRCTLQLCHRSWIGRSRQWAACRAWTLLACRLACHRQRNLVVPRRSQPAMLMALDLLPGGIRHAFWIGEGQKMSKSLGNFVTYHRKDDRTLRTRCMAVVPADQGPLGGQDADFKGTNSTRRTARIWSTLWQLCQPNHGHDRQVFRR